MADPKSISELDAEIASDNTARARLADEAEKKRQEEIKRLEAAKTAETGKPAVYFDPINLKKDGPPASDRLRAFEDRHLGEDATRINGAVERGHGSRFKAMRPEQHAEHSALEHLVKAEKDVADSSAALDVAKQAHAVALKKLDDASTRETAADMDPGPRPDTWADQTPAMDDASKQGGG
jgi:hypothetical protein